MPDREKVIRKLEELLVFSRYNDSVGWNPDNDTETLEGALALLKAQEPVKPCYEKTIKLYICGQCGVAIGVKGLAKYCINCGQAVKWDG